MIEAVRSHSVFSSPLVSYSNDVASVVIFVWQGTFRNRWGYFNETWCSDTFGQYAQSFFDFRDLTYFVASRRPS
jgi:hypothetical protein